MIQDELIDNNNGEQSHYSSKLTFVDYEQEAQLISRMVNQFEGGMFM